MTFPTHAAAVLLLCTAASGGTGGVPITGPATDAAHTEQGGPVMHMGQVPQVEHGGQVPEDEFLALRDGWYLTWHTGQPMLQYVEGEPCYFLRLETCDGGDSGVAWMPECQLDWYALLVESLPCKCPRPWLRLIPPDGAPTPCDVRWARLVPGPKRAIGDCADGPCMYMGAGMCADCTLLVVPLELEVDPDPLLPPKRLPSPACACYVGCDD